MLVFLDLERKTYLGPPSPVLSSWRRDGACWPLCPVPKHHYVLRILINNGGVLHTMMVSTAMGVRLTKNCGELEVEGYIDRHEAPKHFESSWEKNSRR